MRTPIDLPPILSVELIQISDETKIPFAPKAREILGWESKTSLSEGLCATIDYFLRLCSLESAYA